MKTITFNFLTYADRPGEPVPVSTLTGPLDPFLDYALCNKFAAYDQIMKRYVEIHARIKINRVIGYEVNE